VPRDNNTFGVCGVAFYCDDNSALNSCGLSDIYRWQMDCGAGPCHTRGLARGPAAYYRLPSRCRCYPPLPLPPPPYHSPVNRCACCIAPRLPLRARRACATLRTSPASRLAVAFSLPVTLLPHARDRTGHHSSAFPPGCGHSHHGEYSACAALPAARTNVSISPGMNRFSLNGREG